MPASLLAMMSRTRAEHDSTDVHSFHSSVDYAMMSMRTRAEDDSTDVHSFHSSVDYGMMSTRTRAGHGHDSTGVHSFHSIVDYAMMSRRTRAEDDSTDVHSFHSSVDYPMMSSKTLAGHGHDSTDVHSFHSSVDYAMMSSKTLAGHGHDSTDVHSFHSSVDYAMMSRKANNQLRSGVGADDSGVPRFVSIAENDFDTNYWGRLKLKLKDSRSFTLAEVVALTNNFSSEKEIGDEDRIFGVVYKAKLDDGREVEIQRVHPNSLEEEAKIDLFNLINLLLDHFSRTLVGFCEEKDESFLVFEHMKNGSLYDHLHGKNNVEKGSSVLNSWKMRIQIALDAARGIERLNSVLVLEAIRSSRIHLDGDWTARVYDFGDLLLLMNREIRRKNFQKDDIDLYEFGIVLLELLAGKKTTAKNVDADRLTTIECCAIFARLAHNYEKNDLITRELKKIFDQRIGAPKLKNEAHAVELVAYTAMHCVSHKPKDRLTMADVVGNLERALAILEGSINLDKFN